MRLTDIPVPTTPVARGALEVARQFHSEALVNHCVRSYLFGASYAESVSLPYDLELLYVSSMLHDLTLTPAFDSHQMPFEEAGAQVAWVFTTGAGWPTERRVRAGEVIVAHMQPSVDAATDPEGHLLEVSTSLDISGAQPELWPTALRTEILTAYPRLDLAADFGRCLVDQAQRKPGSQAARIVDAGLVAKLAANPLERPRG